MSTDHLGPIRLQYDLDCAVTEAFSIYTERVGEWWHPRYTANAKTLDSVTIEPVVGGRVYATHSDIGEHVWGVVTVWEPPGRLAHSFTLAQDPAHPSLVEVEITPSDTGSVLGFAHAGWTTANAGDRSKFGDWHVMLDRFAALAGG